MVSRNRRKLGLRGKFSVRGKNRGKLLTVVGQVQAKNKRVEGSNRQPQKAAQYADNTPNAASEAPASTADGYNSATLVGDNPTIKNNVPRPESDVNDAGSATVECPTFGARHPCVGLLRCAC